DPPASPRASQMNTKVVLEYDGTGFSGWQQQAAKRTVEGELKRALFELTGEWLKVYGAGRTDAGAHAEGQVVNFRLPEGPRPDPRPDHAVGDGEADRRLRRAGAGGGGLPPRPGARHRRRPGRGGERAPAGRMAGGGARRRRPEASRQREVQDGTGAGADPAG